MMKKMVYILILVLTVGFSGCGNAPEKKYTYEELTDEQKEIIDLVYSSYDKWQYLHDSGEDWGCTNVTFFYEDEQLIFATYHEFSSLEKIGKDVYSKRGGTKVFEVEKEDSQISGHGYSIYESAKKNGAVARASYGCEFDVKADMETQKNVLANTYYKYIIKEK